MSNTATFATKLDQLYKTYRDRINPDCWRELFADPTLITEENFEEVREIFFKYIPVHYMMPNEVYAVIDELFGLREHKDELAKYCPDGFLNFAAAKAFDEYTDFDYTLLIGTPAYDENGVVDLFINTIKELMHPESNIEDPEAAYGAIANSGMVHPWLVFWAKRRDFLAGKLNKEQEEELFDLYREEVPDERHQIRYFCLEYRVYELRGLVCEKHKDYKNAYYYYRLMAFVYETRNAIKLLSDVSDRVVKELSSLKEMDMGEWDIFLDAARRSLRFNEAIKIYEERKDEVFALQDYAFILANISEFYAKKGRMIDAVRTADLIVNVDEEYMDAFMTRQIIDWCYDLVNEDGYNGIEVFKIMEKHCARFKDKFDDDKNGLYDVLYSEGVANCRYGNARFAIALFTELKDMIDRNDMNWAFTELNEAKVRVLFNLYYSYLTCRKCPSAEEINEDMAREAFEMTLQGENFAFSNGNMQFPPAFWPCMMKCCNVTGEYERALEVLLTREGQLLEMQNGDKKAYSDILDALYACAIQCYAKLGDIHSAREVLFKLVGGDLELTAIKEGVKSVNLTKDHDKIMWILSFAIYVPGILTEDETQSVLRQSLDKISYITKNRVKDVKKLGEFMRSLLSYGYATTTDQKAIYDACNDEWLMKRALGTCEARYIAKDFARLSFYAGDHEGAAAYAKKALDLCSAANAYCRQHHVTLEEAVEDGQRYNNRLELSELSECYLFMGDVDKARYYVSKMEGDNMCAYCAKSGCLEKFLDYAQIECYEGNYDEALKYCNLTDSTEWSGHEEIATSIRMYIKRIRG